MKTVYVCTVCGSPRVTFDAAVDPNRFNSVVGIYDSSDCEDCLGECSTKTVEVPDDFDLDTDFVNLGELGELT